MPGMSDGVRIAVPAIGEASWAPSTGVPDAASVPRPYFDLKAALALRSDENIRVGMAVISGCSQEETNICRTESLSKTTRCQCVCNTGLHAVAKILLGSD